MGLKSLVKKPRRFNKRRTVLAVVYLLAGLLILGFGYQRLDIFAKNSAIKYRSASAANVYQTNNELYALPDPKAILPQATSGNLAGQKHDLDTLKDSLEHAKAASPNFAAKLFYSHCYNQVNKLNGQYAVKAHSLASQIGAYTDSLSAMQKFIEYNPNTDLAGYRPAEPDSQQRIERTEKALQDLRVQLQNQPGQMSAELLAEYEPVIKGLEEFKTKPDLERWNSAVMTAQTGVMPVFERYLQKIITSNSPGLLELGQQIAESQCQTR